MNDEFLTIDTHAEGVFRDKGSKFLAFAVPVKNTAEIDSILKHLRKEYYDARHHCYAYRLGIEGETYRANDDGEPSGSAGQPILNQLKSKNLTNILVIVVRYFGGILLGVPGLINAYKNATADALNNAKIVQQIAKKIVQISFMYPEMNDVMKLIKDEKLEQIAQQFDNKCKISILVRLRDLERISQKIEKIEGTSVAVAN